MPSAKTWCQNPKLQADHGRKSQTDQITTKFRSDNAILHEIAWRSQWWRSRHCKVSNVTLSRYSIVVFSVFSVFSFFSVFSVFSVFLVFSVFGTPPLDLSENYCFFSFFQFFSFFSFWDPPLDLSDFFNVCSFFPKMWVPAQDPCLLPLEQVASTYQH